MIWKAVACSVIGIISHGVIALRIQEMTDQDDSLRYSVLAMLLAVLIEVVAWEFFGLM